MLEADAASSQVCMAGSRVLPRREARANINIETHSEPGSHKTPSRRPVSTASGARRRKWINTQRIARSNLEIGERGTTNVAGHSLDPQAASRF